MQRLTVKAFKTFKDQKGKKKKPFKLSDKCLSHAKTNMQINIFMHIYQTETLDMFMHTNIKTRQIDYVNSC